MKKKLAILLAMAMVASTGATTAFAQTAEDLSAFDMDGVGTGVVDSVDNVIYRVVVPIETNLDYIVDPQGLAGMNIDEGASLEERQEFAGRVYANSNVTVCNRSSQPIKLSAKVEVANAGDVTLVDSPDAVEEYDMPAEGEEAPAPVMCLALVPIQAYFETTDEEYEGEEALAFSDTAVESPVEYTYEVVDEDVDDEDEVLGRKGYILTQGSGSTPSVSVTVDVALAAAEYQVIRKYNDTVEADETPDPDNTNSEFFYEVSPTAVGGGVQFKIAGICNKAADPTIDVNPWLDQESFEPVATPELTIVYTFATLAKDDRDTMKATFDNEGNEETPALQYKVMYQGDDDPGVYFKNIDVEFD